MKKYSIQFHATSVDILEFLDEMIKSGYNVCGVTLHPNFEILLEIKKSNPTDINCLDVIIISKTKVKTADNYNDFITKQDNNIGITLGKERDGKLFESIMWIYSECKIDTELKKAMNNFKNKMNRGAWVKDPYSNIKKYYKNHLYTNNAKLAYENGVTICPLAGWNTYELTNESK